MEDWNLGMVRLKKQAVLYQYLNTTMIAAMPTKIVSDSSKTG